MKFIGLSLLFLSQVIFAQGAVVKIDGSSTVYPISEATAEEFQIEQKGKVKVTVGVSGTGGGFKKFCRGETDIQNASRPISKSEMEMCKTAGVKYYELPVGYDAMVVVVNPKNDWVNEITVADLKKIWEPTAQGKVMTWDQVNPKWPKQNLKLFGAGSDSGTFDYFTEAIVGKAKSSRGDYTASEDDNVLIMGVANDKFSLGYVPMSYYVENKAKLKALAIVNDKVKKAVLPSKEVVEDGSYFPLSRPVFIYVSEASYKKADVMNFVHFFMKSATTIVPQVKYVALPQKAYDVGLENLKKGKLGTLFGGEAEIGIKMEELLIREGKL